MQGIVQVVVKIEYLYPKYVSQLSKTSVIMPHIGVSIEQMH